MGVAIGPARRRHLSLLSDTSLLLIQGRQNGRISLILVVDKHFTEDLISGGSNTPATQRHAILLARLMWMSGRVASRIRVPHGPAAIIYVVHRLLILLHRPIGVFGIRKRVVAVDLAQLVHVRVAGDRVLLWLFGRLYDETFATVRGSNVNVLLLHHGLLRLVYVVRRGLRFGHEHWSIQFDCCSLRCLADLV